MEVSDWDVIGWQSVEVSGWYVIGCQSMSGSEWLGCDRLSVNEWK